MSLLHRPMLAACALALAAWPALADDVRGQVAVNGAVARFCALGQPVLTTGQTVNVRALGGGTLAIDSLVDPVTLSTQAAKVSVDFDAVCNYPHRLLLQSQNNGLWRAAGGAPPDGFADAVPYTAILSWGQASARFDADAASRAQREVSLAQDTPVAGALIVELTIAPGAANLRQGAPLLAGDYQDTLRITVQPQ